jgi:hypothetical protein
MLSLSSFRLSRYTLQSLRRFSQYSSEGSLVSPASTPHSKMEKDSRYQPVNPVPQTLLENTNDIHSPGFSIKGEARQGRPAYLDFQATTPLDPRVLDAMVREFDLFSFLHLV